MESTTVKSGQIQKIDDNFALTFSQMTFDGQIFFPDYQGPELRFLGAIN